MVEERKPHGGNTKGSEDMDEMKDTEYILKYILKLILELIDKCTSLDELRKAVKNVIGK